MVDRILHVIGQVSPVVSVALLVCLADWTMLASLYASFPLAGLLLGAGLISALLAIVVACYSAARALMRG